MLKMGISRHLHRWILFAVAFVSGSLLTYIVVLTPRITQKSTFDLYNLRAILSVSSNDKIGENIWDQADYNNTNVFRQNSGDQTIHDNYMKRVRVLCWIMTSPKTLMSKAIHIRNTWGPRCDHTLYMSSIENTTFPAVGLNVSEGRDSLWNKTRAAFKYIHRHNYTKEYDWFLKADDDTYIIVENLKYFLKDKNSSDLVYYGHQFKPFIKNGYMSGGAGYVLSKRAVEKMVTVGFTNSLLCPIRGAYSAAEDLSLGNCMQKIQVLPGDERDGLNRSRFLPFPVWDIMKKNYLPKWYGEYARYKLQKGLACCSDLLISSHYVAPHEMYSMDYFVYHLRPALTNKIHTYFINDTSLPV